MVFSRCIRFSSRLDFGGRCQSWAKKVEELPRPRSGTGKSSTLYRYGLDAGTDFFRAGIFITSAFALAGLSISLLGGKRWEATDRGAVLGAAFAILSNDWRQLRPAILELGDVANLEARVREIAGRAAGVMGFDKCFVRKIGFNYYVDLQVLVNGNLYVRDDHHCT
jgi:divalent metal cation (Fe/Co/Zn/Cd) transporter